MIECCASALQKIKKQHKQEVNIMKKLTRLGSVTLAIMLVLQCFAFVPSFALDTSGWNTVFEFNFDNADETAITTPADLTSGARVVENDAVTDTWLPSDFNKSAIYFVAKAYATTQLQVKKGILAKGENEKVLEIKGYDSSNESRIEIPIIGSKGGSSVYQYGSQFSCTPNGSFMMSFDFATTDLSVPTGIAVTTPLGHNGGSGYSALATTYTQDLFTVKVDGSIKIFNDDITADTLKSTLGTALQANKWYNIKIVFNGSNQMGLMINGKVVRQMSDLTKNDAVADSYPLGALNDNLRIFCNYSNADLTLTDESWAKADASARYYDNLKYQFSTSSSVTELVDEALTPELTFADGALLKRTATAIYPRKSLTVAEFSAKTTATLEGTPVSFKIIDGNGNVMADDDLMANAAYLEAYDANGIGYGVALTTASASSVVSEGTLTGIRGWHTTTADGKTIAQSSNKGGKASDDNFVLWSSTASGSNRLFFNDFASGGVSDLFTVEYSYFPGTFPESGVSNTEPYTLYNNVRKNGQLAGPVLIRADGLICIGGNSTGAYVKENQWNRVAITMDLTTYDVIVYVNGVKAATGNWPWQPGYSVTEFVFEYSSNTTSEIALDDIKVTYGNYEYEQKAAVLVSDNENIVVDNDNKTITVESEDVTKEKLIALAGDYGTAKLFTNDSYTNEATEITNNSVLVVTDGNGMYNYYTVIAEFAEEVIPPEFSFADGALLKRTDTAIYPRKSLTVAEFISKTTAIIDGVSLEIAIFGADGAELAGNALMANAAYLEAYDLNGNTHTLELMTASTEVVVSDGKLVTGWSTTSSNGKTIAQSADKGGKATDDNFLLWSSTASGSNRMIFTNFPAGGVSDLFTVEYSYFPGIFPESGVTNTEPYTLYNNVRKNGQLAGPVLIRADGLICIGGNSTGAYVKENQWNRVAITMDLTTYDVIVYVNGVKAATGNWPWQPGYSVTEFVFEYSSNTTSEIALDDIKVTYGNYEYSQQAITLASNNENITVDNTNKKIAVSSADVTATNIVVLAGNNTAKLFTDATYTAEATTLEDGNILVVADGNGMYGYYTVNVPEAFTSYSYSESEGKRKLDVELTYNGDETLSNVTLIVAQYNGDKLINVGTASLVSLAKSGKISASTDITTLVGSEVKAFLWNGNCAPVLNAIPIAYN